MGFFFRRSARVGPFRLNFSKSGVGASFGVKGARVTLTPRGTTYVTVGSNGFYYRETLSHGGQTRPPRPGPPPAESAPPPADDLIATADSLNLEDSSSERLVGQLNERANMFNPAWIFYTAAIISLFAFAKLPDIPSLPHHLPLVTQLYNADRNVDAINEYAALTALYGEPNSISQTDVDPLVPIPLGAAQYNLAHVNVVFVPNECVNAYGQVISIRSDPSRNAASARRALKGVVQCHPLIHSGWTAVAYNDSVANTPISVDVAARRLDAMTVRRSEAPTVNTGNITGSKQHLISKSAGRQLPIRPEMKSDRKAQLAVETARHEIKSAESWRNIYTVVLLSGGIGLFAIGGVVHKRNLEQRLSRLFYELDEATQTNHNAIQQSVRSLSTCRRIWRIDSESSTSDWKRNAGASSLVRRTTVDAGMQSPLRVKTNVDVPCINMGRAQLYFLPDTILYRDSRGYGAIAYGDFQVVQGFTRFIESEAVPADASVVDHTWLFVNKNGGPDRRFKNNRQLPVLQLGVLALTSSKGLNIQLNTSNPQLSLAFAQCWRTQAQKVGQANGQCGGYQPPPRDVGQYSTQTQSRKILGVNDDSSQAEVSAAYHRLAQMYHPDKVAGLAPEFQALADMRMKEINSAYEVLRQRV